MHIDATTESGTGTLLAILSGREQWVLGAWKIPSESAQAIEPHISEVCALFGEPCSIVRDLGQPISAAAEMAALKMSEPPKIRACHYHFLRDVGKDMLNPLYDQLRKFVRVFSLRNNIRHVIASLRKKVSNVDIADAKRYFDDYTYMCGFPSLPEGAPGISLIILLAQWILDFRHDSKNMGFPFGRPYYNLYRRCTTAANAIDFFLLECRHDDGLADDALKKLKAAIQPFIDSKKVCGTVKRLEARMNLFDKFRALFRLDSVLPEIMGDEAGDAIHKYELFESDMKRHVDKFYYDLKTRYDSASDNNDIKHAIKIVIDHLERHAAYLWGHIIAIDVGGSIKYLAIDRTNNVIEGFFHVMKHKERRRSGRKILTRDFECIPAEAALAMNLFNREYVELVCGTLDKLPDLFSKLDRDNTGSLSNINNTAVDVGQCELMPPIPDKFFVRKDIVKDWMAASSQGISFSNLFDDNSFSSANLPPPPFSEINGFLLQCLP